jgi:hypothetical protein
MRSRVSTVVVSVWRKSILKPQFHHRAGSSVVSTGTGCSRSVNHNVLPIFTRENPAARSRWGPSFVPVARSLATRFAACSLVVIAVSGCSAPGAIGPTINAQPKLARQPVSLDSLAYDPTPTGAVPLPTPSSQAVATTEPGDGQMIGGSSRGPRNGSSDANVVLNLSSVPLQQARKDRAR